MKKLAIALVFALLACSMVLVSVLNLSAAWAAQPEDQWVARPFHIALPTASPAVSGYSPNQIRTAYNLPSSGGARTTIAIIDAYDTPNIQNDLTVFCSQFGLPAPSADNLEVHKMQSTLSIDSGWAMETTLDVEWAHAIAPQAKILLVEAKSDGLTDLLNAVDWARNRADVVSVSMSWGDDEFSRVASYDYHLVSSYGALFFAASGDYGAGVMWPASSVHAVGVGGTTLCLASDGSVSSETGWSGSGGGISAYEAKPVYQTNYGVTGTRRQVPDVSYDGDPNTGFAVYCNSNWQRVGGTSAGAPQWAAIHALGLSASTTNIYQRASSTTYAAYLRDITSGSNGAYNAVSGYDCVTGLGSPLTANFASSAGTSTTNSLTLIPSEQSNPLNSTNQFKVNYLQNGASKSTYASNGTLTLNTDPNTNLTLTGISTGSTSLEKWVFTSDSSPVTGINITLTYYDLVAQTLNYTVTGGGTPQTPTANFLTAPSSVSAQPATQAMTLQLGQTPQTVWSQRGTIVSVSNPLSAGLTEQWSTQTASWTVETPNQVPQTVTYYHQYYTAAGYQVTGGGSSAAPTVKATAYGSDTTSSLPTAVTGLWLDAGSQYTITNFLEPSNSNERWVTNASTTGTVTLPLNISPTYYHQFNISVTYTIQGSEDSASPVFNYTSFGSLTSLTLSRTPQWLWIDSASQYSSQMQLNGSSTTERWFSPLTPGTIQDASALNFTYVHQYLLSISSSQTQPKWYNSGDQAQVSISRVMNRTAGTGQRVTSYSIDGGGIPVEVSPTTSTIDFSVAMDAAHQVNLNSTPQFQVTLDQSTANQLASITPPTISGDKYWYDEGSNVVFSVNGTTSRLGGIGQRIESFTINEVTTDAASTGTIELFNGKLFEPKTVSVTLTNQYLLNTLSGSVKSISAPSISGDTGWYDAATPITITYACSWNSTINQSRLNAISYVFSQGTPVALSRSGNGTFSVQVTLTAPESITVSYVTQYLFNVKGGFEVTLYQASPTNDSFFDAGTIISASLNQKEATEVNNAKQSIASYTLDGVTSNITTAETSLFATLLIPVNSAHQLTFNSATQYLVSFLFKDDSGSKTITPASFQISNANTTENDSPFSVWLNNGTQFQIESVMWQNSDVKPADSTYLVDGPLNVTVLCRVFNATLLIQNNFGEPVADAKVIVTLANQTTVQSVTGSDGAVNLLMIPQGTFTASVKHQDQTTRFSGDASTQTVTIGIISSSPAPSLLVPELSVAAAISVLCAGVCFIALAAKKRKSNCSPIKNVH